MKPDMQKVAKQAIYKLVASYGAALLDGQRGTLPRALGSGTLLRTPSGNVAVLTAKHVFEDNQFDFIRLLPDQSSDTTEAFRAVRVECPQADLAVLLVPNDVATALTRAEHVPLPLEQVAVADDACAANDGIAVVGFPAELVNFDRQQNAVGFSITMYLADGAALKHDPDQRLSLAFDRVKVEGLNELRSLDPKGMSGGAVWWYEDKHVSTSKLWTPSHYLRLIGVQSARDRSRHVLCIESVPHHRTWLDEALAKLDEHVRTERGERD